LKNWRFIIVFPKAHHWIFSWHINPVHSVTPNLFKKLFNVTRQPMSSSLNILSLQGFYIKIFYEFIISLMCVTCCYCLCFGLHSSSVLKNLTKLTSLKNHYASKEETCSCSAKMLIHAYSVASDSPSR
jgi:hypothetical protein